MKGRLGIEMEGLWWLWWVWEGGKEWVVGVGMWKGERDREGMGTGTRAAMGKGDVGIVSVNR